MSRFDNYNWQIAKEYDTTIAQLFGGDFLMYVDLIKTLLQKTEFHPEDEIIELAAGTGIATSQIMLKPYHNLYITDNSRHMLKLAQQRILGLDDGYVYARGELVKKALQEQQDIAFSSFTSHHINGKNFSFMLLDAYDLDNAYNLGTLKANKIILANTFISLSDPVQALRAAYSRLAPGGEFLFNCKLTLRPGEKSLRDVINDILIEENERRKESNLPELFKEPDNIDLAPKYSQEEIKKMLQEAGLTVRVAEEEEVHLWEWDSLKYLQHARVRVEKCFDFDDLQNQQLKVRISCRLFHHYNMPFNFPTLLRREGFFVAQKE